MTPGIYSVVSAMNARWTQQTENAANLSGSTTLGHKRSVVAFGSFNKEMAGAREAQAANGVKVPPQDLVYTKPVTYDWSGGQMTPTGAPLDAAIEGPGFFQIQTPGGPRLTRAGHFMLNNNKELVNDAGYPVLSAGGGTITAENGATISADGTISVKGREINKIAVFNVDRTDALKSDGGALFSANGAKVTEIPAKLAPSQLEMSNVSAPVEMTTMIQNQHMYEMLTRAFQAQDEGLSKAIQDLSGS